MLALRQSSVRVMRPASRMFSTTRIFYQNNKPVSGTAHNLAQVNGPNSLIGEGAKEGAVPTDIDQATGLERLELLGKLEGVDVFDTKPLDASRKGTMQDPIIIDSYDDYRYVGCTGSPAGSHTIMWLKPTVKQVARCWECGSVYKINPVGVEDPEGGHHH